MTNKLDKLALKYKSDKSIELKKHSYTEYYYKTYKNKAKSVKKVLEIGVGSGASLRMWRDYFPNAKIYGADYMAQRMFTEPRIETFLIDQRKSAHLNNLIQSIGGDIDIVIDDGSHRPRDQSFTCLVLMPQLKQNVTYVIEDVYDPTIAERLRKNYDVEVPKITSIKRFDNMLVVVRQKKNIFKKKKGISFFAKTPQRVGFDRHLNRISSVIRGQQIAEFISAKLNPTEDYQNDVCLYVKPPFKIGQDLEFEKKSYLDLVDELGYVEILKKHPKVKALTLSAWNYKTLKKLVPNKIVNIPQQHCNFERFKRERTGVKTVGMIGTLHAFDYLPKGFEEALKKRGIKFIEFSKFTTRQDIVNFYLSIDVQIVWRPYYDYSKPLLVNPLKIVNASSFGVPTIAFTEPAFTEMKGCYIPVTNLEKFLLTLDNLILKPDLYNKYSKKCLKTAEKYHIEKIAKLYKNLK